MKHVPDSLIYAHISMKKLISGSPLILVKSLYFKRKAHPSVHLYPRYSKGPIELNIKPVGSQCHNGKFGSLNHIPHINASLKCRWLSKPNQVFFQLIMKSTFSSSLPHLYMSKLGFCNDIILSKYIFLYNNNKHWCVNLCASKFCIKHDLNLYKNVLLDIPAFAKKSK